MDDHVSNSFQSILFWGARQLESALRMPFKRKLPVLVEYSSIPLILIKKKQTNYGIETSEPKRCMLKKRKAGGLSYRKFTTLKQKAVQAARSLATKFNKIIIDTTLGVDSIVIEPVSILSWSLLLKLGFQKTCFSVHAS